jgi:hypothetical protein
MSALLTLTVAVAIGLLTNELFDISSWLAKHIVRQSAFLRYGDSERAEIRAEELAAYIKDRPGNLFKLFTAVGFYSAAVLDRLQRRYIKNERVRRTLERGPRYRGVDVPSPITARALFPTEKYRGEWRKHWFSPTRRIVVALGVCVLLTAWPEIVLPDAVIEYRLQVGEADVDGASGMSLSYLHGIWTLLPLWTGWAVLNWYLERFMISNKRLTRVSGVITRKFTSVALGRATDVQLRQSFLGRMLNYGTLRLYNVNWFHPMRNSTSLPHPNEIYLQLSEEIYEPEAAEERGQMSEEEFRELYKETIEELFPSSNGNEHATEEPNKPARPRWGLRPRMRRPEDPGLAPQAGDGISDDGSEDPLSS